MRQSHGRVCPVDRKTDFHLRFRHLHKRYKPPWPDLRIFSVGGRQPVWLDRAFALPCSAHHGTPEVESSPVEECVLALMSGRHEAGYLFCQREVMMKFGSNRKDHR